MQSIRYPAITKSLQLSSNEKIFLDSSFIICTMLVSSGLNKYHKFASDLLLEIKTSKCKLFINSVVYTEVVDTIISLLFGNDLILFSEKETDQLKFSCYSMAFKVFQNGSDIITESDKTKFEKKNFKEINFKGYIREMMKDSNRKKWFKDYFKKAVDMIDHYIKRHSVEFLGVIKNHKPSKFKPIPNATKVTGSLGVRRPNEIIPILDVMEKMYLRSSDALHVATAIWHDCTHLITVDEDYKQNPYNAVIEIILITDKKQ